MVECSVVDNIQVNPNNHNGRLGHQKEWGAKEARKTLGSLGEPVTAKDMGQMGVGCQKAQMMGVLKREEGISEGNKICHSR